MSICHFFWHFSKVENLQPSTHHVKTIDSDEHSDSFWTWSGVQYMFVKILCLSIEHNSKHLVNFKFPKA